LGELVKINGKAVKLGTCEDLYYTTHAAFSEALALGIVEKLPGNLPPAEYLKDGFRFRFPFPDEDETEIGTHENYDRGLLFTVSPGFMGKDAAFLGFEHERLCHSASCGGAFNVNIFLPCPACINPYPLDHSPINHDQIPVEIVQQKSVGGELWLVVRCGYCGAKVRVDRDGAAALVRQIRETNTIEESPSGEFWEKVCTRIMAGYETPAGEYKANG